MVFRWTPVSLGIFGMVLAASTAAEPASQAQRPLTTTINLLAASGHIHALQPLAAEPARVVVFFTGECPIATSYVPLLNRLAQEWDAADRQVSLYGVWADPTTTPADVAKFVQEYEIRFPVLLDRDGELARALCPTHVPEAFILAGDGRLVYRGRLDDRYLELGKRRPAATENTLADAVAAVVSGQPVAAPRTQPIGCLYENPLHEPPDGAKLTYYRDIAPILLANCVVCHREGEVGPFALSSYQDAAKRAGQIARVVNQRLMPPWKAAQTHGEFEGQRTLTDRQIAIITAWAEGPRAEGNPADAPPLPQFPNGWRFGEPDLVLEMPADFEIRPDGPDIFQNFPIPIDVPTDKLVAMIDFLPGNPRVVHHSLLFLDFQHAGRKLDEKTPEPGYASFGDPGFLPTGSLGGWSPGKTPRRLPAGLGRYLKKGSDLVMQIHYHPTGKRELDRSKVGVYFVEKPQDVAIDIWAASFDHDIPPGEKDYRLSAAYTLPCDLTLLGVVPHMHLLGHELTATAVLPGGEERPLIHIPQWNFNWQDDYRYARPFKLPKGTRLEVAASYDNSAANPANPSSPPRRVGWGEQTTDEMLYCFFFVTVENRADLIPLATDVLTKEIVNKAAARLRK